MNKTNAQQYFDNHAGVDVFYFTSDGQAFFTENDAQNHARVLGLQGKDDGIEEVSREEIAEPHSGNINEPGEAGADIVAAQLALDEATAAKASKKTISQLTKALEAAKQQ